MSWLPWVLIPVDDPACGAKVDAKSDTLRIEYHGKLYCFCSLKCMGSFMAEPAKYAK
jgi:YHS domain-containing protein